MGHSSTSMWPRNRSRRKLRSSTHRRPPSSFHRLTTRQNTNCPRVRRSESKSPPSRLRRRCFQNQPPPVYSHLMMRRGTPNTGRSAHRWQPKFAPKHNRLETEQPRKTMKGIGMFSAPRSLSWLLSSWVRACCALLWRCRVMVS